MRLFLKSSEQILSKRFVGHLSHHHDFAKVVSSQGVPVEIQLMILRVEAPALQASGPGPARSGPTMSLLYASQVRR